MLNMMMNEMMMRAMKNFGDEVSSKAIAICAEKYGFSAEEAIRELGGISVSVKPKERKEKKEKAKKCSMVLPFNGECDMSKCHALRQNSGLYTQCQSSQSKDVFCNNCHKLAEKSEDGMPEYGTIQQRMEAYTNGVEYVDPKGRKPVAYLKVMKKYKLTQEQVVEEAGKFGIEINAIHFEMPADTKRGRPASKPKEPKEPKGSKGRPKKEKKVIIAEDDDDLFASLVASANADIEEDDNEIVIPMKKSSEAKEAEKQAKEAEKQAKALEKAEKEAKIAAEKATKEAEKAAKALAKQAAGGGAKKKKEDDDDEEPEVVKKITFEDKKYLLSKKSGVIYDYEKYVNESEQVVVGKWNVSENKIDFTKAEESEDEYESDDE